MSRFDELYLQASLKRDAGEQLTDREWKVLQWVENGFGCGGATQDRVRLTAMDVRS
jgi:hypothetical protein